MCMNGRIWEGEELRVCCIVGGGKEKAGIDVAVMERVNVFNLPKVRSAK